MAWQDFVHQQMFHGLSKGFMSGPELLIMQGFPIGRMDFSGVSSKSLWSLWAGNAMSVPTIGACLLAVISFVDLGHPSWIVASHPSPRRSPRIVFATRHLEEEPDDVSLLKYFYRIHLSSKCSQFVFTVSALQALHKLANLQRCLKHL